MNANQSGFTPPLILALLLASLSGCSLRYVDENQVVNQVGFLHVRYKPGSEVQIVNIKDLGVAADFCWEGAGIRVGYRDRTDISYLPPSAAHTVKFDSSDSFATSICEGFVGFLPPSPP
ncbi:MAG: hypothetical protein G8345_09295 [Magnetococcales bacterium]|nr:hypothetical protein [Magnetococcales bacterium]NGZ27070.1 hypothetical protein [Magnetococcales bacterium]